MQLGRITYRNITQSQPVQTRLQIIHQALASGQGGSMVYSKSVMEAMQFQARVSDLHPGGKSIYICSSGDLSHFMFATGKKEFFCFDMLPFFHNSKHGPGWMLFGEHPSSVLSQAAFNRQRIGYWHNQYIKIFNETGIFMLFEILGLGGENLNVFEAKAVDGLCKITFDLRSERYCVYFQQADLKIGNEMPLLDPAEIGLLMIKAGDGAGLANLAYEFLERTVIPDLMPGALIFSDRRFSCDFLEVLFQKPEAPACGLPQRIMDDAKYGEIQFLYQLTRAGS